MRKVIIAAAGMTLASAIVWQHSTSHAARPSQAQRTESARSRSALISSPEPSSAGPLSTGLQSLEPAESFASSRRTVSREASSPVRAAAAQPPPAGVEDRRGRATNAPRVPQTVLPSVPTVAGVSSPRPMVRLPGLAARRGGELDEPTPNDVLERDADALGALADIFAGDSLPAVVSATRRSAQPVPSSRR